MSIQKIGTFAETAIVDYRLSLADQGKQISVFSNLVCHQHSWASASSELCLASAFRYPP
jgi:hypothetical protein